MVGNSVKLGSSSEAPTKCGANMRLIMAQKTLFLLLAAGWPDTVSLSNRVRPILPYWFSKIIDQKETKMATLVLLYLLFTQTGRTGPSKMTESRMFSTFWGYKTVPVKKNRMCLLSSLGKVSIKKGQTPTQHLSLWPLLKTSSHGSQWLIDSKPTY